MSLHSKRIVCRLHVNQQAPSIELTWSEGSASFKPYALEGPLVSAFRTNIQKARERLLRLVIDHEAPRDKRDPIACRHACFEQRDPAACRHACFKLALAGHDLYNQLFDPGTRDGEHVADIAEWLREATRSGSVESLEFVCNGQPWFAPWNLIYDEEPEQLAFDMGDGGRKCLEPFWGMRYNVCGGQSVNPLRRMPLPAKPEVLVVIDPVVLDSLERYADSEHTTQRGRLERFLSRHHMVPITSRSALAEALKERRPHIIYWLGHAEPNALHLGPRPIDQVDLGNLLRNMKRIPGQTGGLVFLNACRTAEPADLGSFLGTFHDAGFSGLIGTEEQTLDSFANPFGLGVLEHFFVPETAIGSVLRDLREAHGPLGLLYGAYCPPDLHLRAEEATVRPEVPPASDFTAAGGRMLNAGSLGAEVPAPTRPLPDIPYLPLNSYGPKHRALFAGRDEDISRFALILDRAETRVMVLHGESGVGKTSFLRAGLIPYLEEDCIGYRFLRDRSRSDEGEKPEVLFVRATDDPAAQIAQALCGSVARAVRYRTPTGGVEIADLPVELAAELGMAEPPNAAVLVKRLVEDPSLLARLLSRLSRILPVKPVLVIDQAEEMFTLARSESQQRGRDQVIEMIRKVGEGQGDYKLIVSLRTEYYGRLVSALRRDQAEADGVREYLLADLEVSAMVEVICRPTLRNKLAHATEIPFEKYSGFDFATRVPEAIASEVAASGRTDGVALLLQVICAQLFERAMARADHCVTDADRVKIGGFDGALGRHVERQITALLPDSKWDRERFQELMTQLTLSQVDGTLSTALLPEDNIRQSWKGKRPFDDLLARARDLRLLRVTTRRLDAGHDERLISLGHDALARVAQPWKLELERKAERRKWRIRAIVAVAVVVGSVVFCGLLVRKNRQLEIAQDEAKTALNFLEGHVLAAARPEGQDGGLGRDVTVRQAVDAAEPQIAAELKGRRTVEASVRRALGLTYYYLGELSLAISQDERALELFRGMLGPDHPDSLAAQQELAVAYRANGRLDRAIPLLEQTLMARQVKLGLDHPDSLAAQQELAVAYQIGGKLDRAIPLLERTLDARRATLGPDHPLSLGTQHNLAYAYQVDKRLDLAIPLFEQTLAARQAKLGPVHPDTLASQNNLAYAYQVDGKLDLAIPLFEQVLAARQAKLGPDHPLSLNTQSGLAFAFQLAGNLDQAIYLSLLTLEARKAKLGPDHPDTLASQQALAYAYQVDGKRGGTALLEQTLMARSVSRGPDHPDTLASQNDLAYAYQVEGKLDRAIPLFEQALEARQVKLGPVHPDTLASQNNLAYARQLAGRLDLAIPLFEQTLEARKVRLGPDHPDTLASQNNLAYAYQADGKLDLAIPLFEQALAARRVKLGPDHLDSLASQNNLAYAYQVDGRLDLAIPLFLQTLEARKARLGPDHPDTLASQNNLAYAYQVDGKLDLAIPLFLQTMEARRIKLGPDHPDSRASQNDLAYAYQVDGKLDLAIPLFEQTLEARKAKLGPDHPDTLTSQNNLALAYADQINGERGRGIALLEQTLEARRTKLGPDHPDTLVSQHDLALAYQVDGRLDRAIQLLEQTLTARKAKLGPDHPHTLISQNNLAAAYQMGGDYGQSEKLFRDIVARQASKHRAGHPILASTKAMLGENLLKQHNWYDAELLFRECLAMGEARAPDSWTTFHIRSSLGASLLGQEKYAEAEPLILSGYEGMRSREARIRSHEKALVVEAGEGVIQLYEAWGKAEKVAEWHRKIQSRAETRRPGLPAGEIPAHPFVP